MALDKYLFTSESVSEGHPDKVADRISDSIIDAFLELDPVSRVAVETMVTTNFVALAGEVRGPDEMNHEKFKEITRQAIKDIGYEQRGFHWKDCEITSQIHSQSADIAQGVDEGSGTDTEEGAGDQGIMFGYATNETPELMPAPIMYSHQILRRMAEDRHSGKVKGFGPDSKSQVTLAYENGKPVRATSLVVSTQHDESLSLDNVRELVLPYFEEVLPEGWLPSDENIYVNPTGRFVIGGPDGDAGLTGRKIIVDTYGGAAPHGGGAFSGKDPTKVDRSAAYAARYLAKNIVAAGLSDKCTIQLSYAIGISKPLSVYVDTAGTNKVDEEKISQIAAEIMDLSPRGIREHLQLNRPIYKETSAYGHFGRTPTAEGHFSWEKTDLVDELKRQF
ncbi:methionine adenosyltransferase 1 [Candidatus Terasakiella magnetica]|uniref:S-adenosylmethionine synthase n=1 Tax=Candidatus Terasakiella magnetica TaxID=1867952 RepID=A0A1C3RE93_9PROT|nr:methionine adenosyltransferase [Candidatus Terasakiella magnetica]SCA55603.1 methionine adenosyltransferase 1 [Candidatus Terasakiella magnetica]